ncbi:PKD domain-containing protein [Hymenobacter sp. GOD-10R]|uniref:PKD domain-containing protein n=1 Tax=Hymenobacter sp. GOD-10R TaxID=3093922 RepID=UPI002D769360|nr:PA14 domain-containing protein [Hymenobacter sp. GOD-10R]WRQ27027.1 PA14 domain-containing protein [Hymenobacter sp. GOD-10R]
MAAAEPVASRSISSNDNPTAHPQAHLASPSVRYTTAASTKRKAALVDLRTPENPASTVSGLDYKYYEGFWKAIPNFTTLTPLKTGAIMQPALTPAQRDYGYAMQFTGYVTVPTDGQYTFYVNSDDGSLLYIGNTLVVNNDGTHGDQELNGTIGLQAGTHAITVAYLQDAGGQNLQVSYAGPGLNKQLIPASAYKRASTSTSNKAPVANAGAAQTITLPTSTVTLNGSGTDSDGTVTGYLWSQVSGPSTGTFSNKTVAAPSVSGLQAGTYVFSLVVTDNLGALSTESQVTVTVNAASGLRTPENPTNTVAGLDYKYYEGFWDNLPAFNTLTPLKTGTVTAPSLAAQQRDYAFAFQFTGYVTVPTDGQYTFYSNSDDGSRIYMGSTLLLDNDGSHGDREIASTIGLKAGTHAITIAYLQGYGGQNLQVSYAGPSFAKTLIPASAYKRATTATNQAPVANAGANQSITLPTSSATLSGSGTDADGTVASYAWTQVSGPNTATFTNKTVAQPVVSGLTAGTYVFSLIVTDNLGLASAAAQTSVTVSSAANQAPVANAGASKTITLPTSSTTLSGSGTDADGTIASYAWTQVSGPNTATFSSKTIAAPTVSGLAAGSYVFSLIVTDNLGLASAASQTTVTVNTVANQAPVANAGASQTITLPTSSVTLTGSGTDADGTVASYAWTQVSGPNTATFTNKTVAQPVVSGLAAGTYVFSLIVTDNLGLASAAAQTTVTVNAASNLRAPENPANAVAGLDYKYYEGYWNALPTFSTLTPTRTGTVTTPTLTAALRDNGYAFQYTGYVTVPTDGQYTFYTSSDDGSKLYIGSTQVVNNDGLHGDVEQAGTIGLQAGTHAITIAFFENDGGQSLQVSYAGPSLAKQAIPAAAYKRVATTSNQAPVANAGANQTLTLPTNTATLNGTASTDVDGTISSYSWAQVSGPSNASFSSTTAASATVSNLVAGTYVFSLVVADNQGALSNPAQVSITVNQNGALRTPENPANTVAGLDYKYYEGFWDAVPNYSTLTPLKTGTTTAFELTAQQRDYAFSFQFTGYVTVPTDGQYTFYSNSDDGSLLYIGSTLLVNNDGSHDSREVSGTIGLKAGTHAFTVSYLQGYGSQNLQVSYAGPNFAKTIIPTSALKRTTTATNQAPVANAGANQSITLPTSSVTLAGSGTDADGTVASYAWNQVSGPNTATFSSKTIAAPTVSGLAAGTYVFSLIVTDNLGLASAAAQVSITVNAAANQAPVANAGANKSITLPTSSVTLSGSGTDADGTIATYAWNQVSGPNTATFSNKTVAQPVVSGLAAGTYVFSLIVTDNLGLASAAAQTSVTVSSAANQAPVANAGASKTITLPTSSTTLSGSGTDADGTIATYAWTQVSGPNTATFSNKTVAQPVVSGLAAGSYVFSLIVTDNLGVASAASQTTVTVNAAANQAPVANAGANQSITLPTSSVTLSGSGTDADGTIATYAWNQVSGPNTATFTNKTVAQPVVSGLAAGTYVFSLVVTDNLGLASAAAQTTVTVNPSACQLASPTVNTPVTYCQGSTASPLSASVTLTSGATLKIYTVATGGTSLAADFQPSTAALGNTTYYVAQASGTCESGRTALVVTVTAVPGTPNIATTVTLCVGTQSTALTTSVTAPGSTQSGTPTPASALRVYTAATGGTALAANFQPSTAAVGTTTYYVSQVAGTCESARVAVTVNVVSSVPAPVVIPPAGVDASNIAAWGDSFTDAQYGYYPQTLSQLSGYSVANLGIGGQTSVQIKDRMLADPAKHTWPTIIWAGRNDSDQGEQVKASIAAMVAALPHKEYIVVSVYNGSGESPGTYGYEHVMSLNADLASIYGSHFMNIRPYTVSMYNPSDPIDVADYNNDTPPTSLRSDFLHPNKPGCSIIANYIYAHINQLLSVNYCQGATSSSLSTNVRMLNGATLKVYTAATGGTALATDFRPSTTTIGSTTYYVSQTLNGCESARTAVTVNVNNCSSTATASTSSARTSSTSTSTSTSSMTSLSAFDVYPNPFSQQATVDFTFTQTQSYSLELYDSFGRKVQQIATGEAQAATSYSHHIDGTNLNEGIYVVRLVAGKFSKTFTLTLSK